MATEKGVRKDKNQNIQVFVRLRPLNQRERDIKSLGVVEVVNGREVVVRQSSQTSHTKKFTFDKAFAPHAKQVEVYQDVVSPLIEEVLAGYNCTVFAYGQTGTGKTHTMVGEHTSETTSWQNDPLAGIIPRALSQLFDELRLSNTEYTVRVSYLELYNEELFDLLSTSEDNSKLRIYEDVTRKGSNIVNGLEEITVYNKNEVYKIMSQGQERKKVASTLMNAQSSRSHTVFTIVVHMKENSPEGEELVKIGKLNLVDLAGSENISKAGSDNPAKKERARECVNINQSLLTLGRVITALVERHPHIPYRESKLTRILQESLGGRTKTSIIATISPGHKDLEETMSTLEYAHRAKNIQNKPEINQKMTKKAILKEYAEEIDRLKRDLQASRDKNGVYLASETYTEIMLKAEEQNKEIQNLILQKRAMEEERDKMESIFGELNSTLRTREEELENTKTDLEDTKHKLSKTKNVLERTAHRYDEQRQLVSAHVETETALSQQARSLLQTAEVATNHVHCLQDTVDKRRSTESRNLETTRTYLAHSQQLRDALAEHAQQYASLVTQRVTQLATTQDEHNAATVSSQQESVQCTNNLLQTIVDAMAKLHEQADLTQTTLATKVSEQQQQFDTSLTSHCNAVEQLLRGIVETIANNVAEAKNAEAKGKNMMEQFVQQWYASGCSRVSSLVSLHGRHVSGLQGSAAARTEQLAHVADKQRLHAATRTNALHTYLDDLMKEREIVQDKLDKQIIQIHKERDEAQERLRRWAEAERRSLEERIANHISEETNILEQKLSQKVAQIEEERRLLEEKLTHCKEWQERQLLEAQSEMELAEYIMSEQASETEKMEKILSKYDKEFNRGASEISIDMEAFSRSIMELVDHTQGEMMKGVQQAAENVQEGVTEVLSTDAECAAKVRENASSMFRDVLLVNKEASDNVLSHVEEYNKTCTQELSSISEQISQSISHTNSHHSVVRDTLAAIENDVAVYQTTLQADVTTYQQVENKMLHEDYAIYSPTGKTPGRQQYRYPRALAATSPHERILARYRAARETQQEEDCIVIECDESAGNSPQSSDLESSVSEGHRFRAPTPRTRAQLANGHALVKSTSESDIYVRKHNGKENSFVESSSKKPSKLPAPTSHKKPLVDRNTSVN